MFNYHFYYVCSVIPQHSSVKYLELHYTTLRKVFTDSQNISIFFSETVKIIYTILLLRLNVYEV